jgi:hypothetical protein
VRNVVMIFSLFQFTYGSTTGVQIT